MRRRNSSQEAEKDDFSFFAIGVEGADMNMLRRLNPRRSTPLRLAEVKDFAKFFALAQRVDEGGVGVAAG